MVTTELTIEELSEIVGRIATEYGMLRVYLFGSRARGDNRPDSDYDFCVLTDDGCTLFTLGGFYSDLRDAIGTEIDIVSEDAIEGDFREEVLKDRIVLYEA